MIKRLLIIATALLLLSAPGFGKMVGDVNLPDTLTAGKASLILNGAGFRTKWFVKVYAGGLYLKDRNADPEKIIAADEAMGLRLHIVYDGVTGKKMTDAMNEGFDKATEGNTDPIKDEINAFNAVFKEEIKKNDIFDIIYLPGDGVTVAKNGKKIGSIAGFEFKKALFGIWLCDTPADKKLKQAMLGK